MLDSQNYKQGVDIWSAGCTLYELIKGKPLFDAKHYLNLIKQFIEKMGTPDEETLSFIKNDQAI